MQLHESQSFAKCSKFQKLQNASPSYTVYLLSFVAKCFGLFLPQILVNFEDQGQFWNLHVLRIPKHPLKVEFDEDLAEILQVEHNPYFRSYF